MSKNDPPADDAPLTDDDRQRLVAYLDGELSPEESRAVESELAASGAVRSELQRLDRVWNALDELPRATVDDRFTRSTVEMVAVEAQQEVNHLTTVLPAQRRRRGYGTIAACIGALLLGVVIARGMATRNDRRVLAALPVVYQVDALGQFQEPDFLRELRQQAPGLVAEFEQGEYQNALVEDRVHDWRQIIAGTYAERAEWVSQQTDAERLRLQRAFKRYTGGSDESRASSERLLTRIRRQADSDELYSAAIAYQAWLLTHSPSEQSRLRQIEDPSQRVAEVVKLYRSDRFKAARTLSSEDASALREAIKELSSDAELARLREQIVKRIRRNMSALTKGSGKSGGRPLHERIWFQNQAPNFPVHSIYVIADLSSEQPTRRTDLLKLLLQGDYVDFEQDVKAIWPKIERRLTRDLSSGVQQQLGRMDGPRRAARLRDWVEETAQAAMRPDNEAIEAFFASSALTDQQRHELLALPSEEMKRRLRGLYLRSELGGSMRPEREGRGRRRGGEKGPRSNGPHGRSSRRVSDG